MRPCEQGVSGVEALRRGLASPAAVGHGARPRQPKPPGGGPDLTAADLASVDGLVMLNAHPSRARLNTEWLDPAIVDELEPFERDPALDMYNRDNGPPFTPEFVERYRAITRRARPP